MRLVSSRYWPESLWILFAAANVGLMFVIADWETVPFHNVWVSLALLYCVRRWALRVTAAILLCVVVICGGAFAYVVLEAGDAGYDELAEIPMMAAMFLVIVFFAWMRQQALDEVRRSAERERDFIRDVSHYLRTPITVALGHAELIRAGSADGQLADDAQIVVEELERVSTISHRLLLLASPEDHLHVSHEEIDPGDLASAAARRWSATAPRRWELDVSSHGTIVGDWEQLTLALDCLVDNAVHATSEGDLIAIRARADRGVAVLEVADTGSGISESDQERIFERFARGSQNGMPRTGAGLGLALAKAIAEAHGGSLEVESTLGEGSTFRLRLTELLSPRLPVTAAAYRGRSNGTSAAAERAERVRV